MIRSSLRSFLFSRLKQPRFFRLSWYFMCSRPWSIVVTICCTLWYICVPLVHGSPKWDAVLHMLSYKCQMEGGGGNHFTCCLRFYPMFFCFYLLQGHTAHWCWTCPPGPMGPYLWSCFPASWPLACATVWVIPSRLQGFVFAELREISRSSFLQSVKSPQTAALWHVDYFSPVGYHLQSSWLESMLLHRLLIEMLNTYWP